MKNKYKKYQQQAKTLLVKGKFVVAKKIKQYLVWEHSWKTTSVGLVVVFVAVFLGFNILHTTALTTTLKPDGDSSTGWTITGGTNDATCTGGTHCDFVDEGTSPVDTDYISTGTNGSGSEREAYTLSTQTGIASATQVVVNARLRYGTLGSTADTVAFGLRINGVDQTATTATMTASFTNYTATFNGSWTQADVDSMEIYMIRTVVGSSGPASSRDDDVQVSNVYATLTYTPSLLVSQSAYRWFSNQDTATQTAFVTSYGDTGGDYALSMAQTTDGGYIITGNTVCGSGKCVLLSKFDGQGKKTWEKVWGNSSVSSGRYGASVIQTSDGGYVVAGYNTLDIGGSLLIKYDSSGTLLWQKVWSDSLSTGSAFNSVIETSDGGLLAVGFSTASSTYNILMVKFTSSGNESWKKTYGSGLTSIDARAYDVIQTSDGNYAIAGQSNNDVLLAKFDTAGASIWAKTLDVSGVDSATSLVENSDGSFVINGDANNDVLLAKFDSTGTSLWRKTWGGASVDNSNSLAKTTDGGYVVGASTQSYGAGNYDAAIIKYDSLGNVAWNQTWGTSNTDKTYTVVQATDGGYAMAAYTTDVVNAQDIIIAKYSASGVIAGCSVSTCMSPTATVNSPAASAVSATLSSVTVNSVNTSGANTEFVKTITATALVSPSVTTIDVGSSLTVAQDTAATAPAEGTPFRLRLNLHISGSQIDASASSYKLRYALLGNVGQCNNVTSGSYADVTDASTIRYYNNTNASSGLGLTTNANDPTHSTDTLVRQTYRESGTTTFTNPTAIPAGQDGMWDFALVANHTLQNDHYCFKVTNSDGTDLNSYTSYPELIIPAATFSQAAYRWYNPEPSGTNQTFAKVYGTIQSETGKKLITTSDGGYATLSVGTLYSNTASFLSKYSADGALQWTKAYTIQSGNVELNDVIESVNSGYVLVGYSEVSPLAQEVLVIRTDSAGEELWTHSWGDDSTENDYATAVAEDSVGNLVVAGTTYSYGDGVTDGLVLVYDDAGGLNYVKTIGSASSVSETLNAVSPTSDGGFIVTGSASNGMILAKYTSTATLSWNTRWSSNGTNDAIGKSVKQTSDGGYIVAGESDVLANGTQDAMIIKYDSSGGVVWDKVWGGTGNEYANDLVITSDGGYALAGYTMSYGNGSGDVLFLKYSSNGTLSWQKTWGTENYEEGQSIVNTSDGGYAIGGTTAGSFSVNDDVLILKYDSSGSISGCTSTLCKNVFASTENSPVAVVSALTITTVSPSAALSAVIYVDPVSFNTQVILGAAITVGNPLAPLNSGLDMSMISPLNLRIAIAVESSGIDFSGSTFKLQYAIKGGAASCSAVGTGYADVTGATPIAYYDNSSHSSNDLIEDNINDPSDGSRTMVPQSYQETNNFTNNQSIIYAGQDGMWQFSLAINNTTLKGQNFCLRIATSGGSLLTAANVADVAYAPQMTQMLKTGKWFNRQGYLQPFSL
jgi:hypothetical protein